MTTGQAPVFVTRFALQDPGQPQVPPDAASDVTVDQRNHLLYIAGNAGLWVFDIGHLTWTQAPDGTLTPPTPGFVSHGTSTTGPISPLLDPDTGLAFTGVAGGKIGVVQQSASRIVMVKNSSGQAVRSLALRQESDVASALEPLDAVLANGDVDAAWSPRIAVSVPGGAGQTITVDVASTRADGHLRPAGAGDNPPTRLTGSKAVVLHPQRVDRDQVL